MAARRERECSRRGAEAGGLPWFAAAGRGTLSTLVAAPGRASRGMGRLKLAVQHEHQDQNAGEGPGADQGCDSAHCGQEQRSPG